MRARDNIRHYVENIETEPENIEIAQLPPTMEDKAYDNAKYNILGFWSYFYNKARNGINKPLSELDLDYSRVSEVFDEYIKGHEDYLAAIPEAARRMDPHLFQLLKLTGIETDLAFIDELESRFGKVPALKLAVKLMDHTFTLWMAHGRIEDGNFEDLNIDELRALRENALEMAKYTVTATHVTGDDYSAKGINKHGFIENSDWRYKDDTDYEGNGVYVGIFGAYRTWNMGTKLYEFPLDLKNALPILVGSGELEAMANTLTEYVRVQDKGLGEALGVRQWWLRSDQADMDFDGELLDWQENLLRELYGDDFTVYRDSEGLGVAVIDTADPPIVLATVGKYLNLYRCMSESSWNKLPESEKMAVRDAKVNPFEANEGIHSGYISKL